MRIDAVREAMKRGELVIRADRRFNGVKIFSATATEPHDHIAATANAWIEQHEDIELVDITVVRSIGASSRCVSIVIRYWQPLSRR